MMNNVNTAVTNNPQLTEKQKKARAQNVNEYNKQNTKCVQVRLNLNNDYDIIKKLDNVPSKMGYIKRLIREDIAKNEKKE